MPTTTRYWRSQEFPATVGREVTTTDPSTGTTTVSGVIIGGLEEITQEEYVAALAAQSTGTNPLALVAAAREADRATLAQAAEDAYNDLIANGVQEATATTLTGHAP